MKGLIFIAVALMLFSSPSFASNNARYGWLDVEWANGVSDNYQGFDFGAVLGINISDGRKGWELGVSYYREYGFSFVRLLDNDQEIMDPELRVLALLRTKHRPARFGVLKLGYGVALLDGVRAEKCNEIEDSFFITRYQCQSKDVSPLGIPLSASMTLGKYAGVGLSARALFLADDEPFISFGIFVSLGKFN